MRTRAALASVLKRVAALGERYAEWRSTSVLRHSRSSVRRSSGVLAAVCAVALFGALVVSGNVLLIALGLPGVSLFVPAVAGCVAIIAWRKRMSFRRGLALNAAFWAGYLAPLVVLAAQGKWLLNGLPFSMGLGGVLRHPGSFVGSYLVLVTSVSVAGIAIGVLARLLRRPRNRPPAAIGGRSFSDIETTDTRSGSGSSFFGRMLSHREAPAGTSA